MSLILRPPSLKSLPTEIHSLITSNLPAYDIYALRSTCRHFYHTTPQPQMPLPSSFCSLSNEARDALLEIEKSWWARENEFRACMFCVRMRGSENFQPMSGEWSGPDAGPIGDRYGLYWRFCSALEGMSYLKEGYDDIDYETFATYWRRCEDCVGERFDDDPPINEWSINDTYVCYRCEDVLELVDWPPEKKHVLNEGRKRLDMSREEETDVVRFERGKCSDDWD